MGTEKEVILSLYSNYLGNYNALLDATQYLQNPDMICTLAANGIGILYVTQRDILEEKQISKRNLETLTQTSFLV